MCLNRRAGSPTLVGAGLAVVGVPSLGAIVEDQLLVATTIQSRMGSSSIVLGTSEECLLFGQEIWMWVEISLESGSVEGVIQCGCFAAATCYDKATKQKEGAWTEPACPLIWEGRYRGRDTYKSASPPA